MEINLAFKTTLLQYINIRLNSNMEKNIKILHLAGESFAFHFNRSGVSLHSLQPDKSNTLMYAQMTENKLLSPTESLNNTYYAQTRAIIRSNVSGGIIQFFFENFPDGFNVYVANENNKILAFHKLTVTKDELVQKVNRFYASKENIKKQAMSPANFNLPQFYDITLALGEGLKMTPFKSSYQIAKVTS